MATSTMNPAQFASFNQYPQPGMQPTMQGGYPPMQVQQAPMQNMQTMQAPMQMGAPTFTQGQMPQPQILADNWNNTASNYNQPVGFAGGGMAQPIQQQPSLLSGLSDIQRLKEMSGSVDDLAGHMKYCACEACKAKKTGASRYQSVLEASPQKAATKSAPTNLTCQNTYCVEVRNARGKLDAANQEVQEAATKLHNFTVNFEALKLAATKAERKAENAMDNVTDLKDKHSKMNNVMDPGDQSRVSLEQELAQGQRFAEGALYEAADAATKVQTESQDHSIYTYALVEAKSAVSGAYSAWTVAVCKASAACNNCNWFDELDESLKDKCTYSCSKCGFKADFYDIDKHEAACSGDKSKIYHCSNGCGFCGEFEIVETHETTTCPSRGRAPIAMPQQQPQRVMMAPSMYTSQPNMYTSQPNMYTSQTLPVNAGRMQASQSLYTSTPNINMQSMQQPVQARRQI